MSESIETSSFLSKLPLIGREQPEDVLRKVPGELVPLLNGAGIDFVLVGAHGIGGWLSETHATPDVDFIVRPKDLQRAAQVILRAFSELNLEKHTDVWKFASRGEYLIDLIVPHNALLKRIASETEEIIVDGQSLRIPALEAAVAMKFAMLFLRRHGAARLYAIAEFMSIVEANKKMKMELVRELGELVHPGGGAEILKMVEAVRAGRKLEI